TSAKSSGSARTCPKAPTADATARPSPLARRVSPPGCEPSSTPTGWRASATLLSGRLNPQENAGLLSAWSTGRSSRDRRGTTMPDSASGPDERARASDAARRALVGLARDRGAEFITREAYRGSDTTIRDVEPLIGARAARDIELGARRAAREYIREARE